MVFWAGNLFPVLTEILGYVPFADSISGINLYTPIQLRINKPRAFRNWNDDSLYSKSSAPELFPKGNICWIKGRKCMDFSRKKAFDKFQQFPIIVSRVPMYWLVQGSLFWPPSGNCWCHDVRPIFLTSLIFCCSTHQNIFLYRNFPMNGTDEYNVKKI